MILNKYQPICFAIQETLIKNRIVTPPTQYEIITSKVTRNDNHERGAAMLIHKSYNYEEIQLNTNLQVSAIKIYLQRTYTVCSIYLPHIPVTKLEIVQLINQLPKPFIIMGDMNARSAMWYDRQTNEKGRIIEEILLENDIAVVNCRDPTHYHSQTNSYSIVDLAICSSDCQIDFQHEVISDLYDSDHYPGKLKLLGNNIIPAKLNKFSIKKADWTNFKQLTMTNVQELPDIDTATDHITDSIINAAEQSIPRVKTNLQRPPMPWWNEECDDVRRERARAERAVKQNPSDYNKIRYNRAKAICRLVFNKRKKETWKHYIDSINCRTNSKAVWTKVKKIQGKFNINATPVVYNPNGVLETDPLTVANTMAEYFASVSKHEDQDFNIYKKQVERVQLNLEGNNQPYNCNITQREFDSALKTTKDNSPGPDEITYSMLKQLHPTMQQLILKLYNKILTQRQFPNTWKIAIIIPIRKGKEKDFKQCCNYRPISLTNCLCKLLEKIINIRLMWYLEVNNNITPYQSGFRHNRSTTDPIVQLENTIKQEIARKKHIIAVFFDIQKAYDTAWRHYIISKLHQYGLRGHLVYFIKNFLSNRRIKVKIMFFSDSVRLEEGIPQGSALSCTCFLIAMNEIAANLPPTLHRSIYVDDFAIYGAGRNIQTVKRQLQIALNKLTEWSRKTGFKFSQTKTKTMHICRVIGCNKMSPTLKIQNTVLPHVEQYKYLGMRIDNSLSWRAHTTHLKQTCSKAMGLLKTLSYTQWGADRTTLLKLYLAVIKPKLDYGCEAYSSACKTYLESLQPIQNNAIRIALGAFKSTPIISLHAESGLKTLDRYRDVKMINYYIRVKGNADQSVWRNLTYAECELLPYNNRIKKPYICRIKEVLTKYNIAIENIAMEKMQVSVPWKPMGVDRCIELNNIRKADYSKEILKQIVRDHITNHESGTIVYTDGSKTETSTAYAIWDGRVVKAKKIPNICSIYTAELIAIREAVRRTNCREGSCLTICTDSKSAIQGIGKYNNKHPIVSNIIEEISHKRNTYRLCWIPSHIGLEGNEAADRAAVAATNSNDIEDCNIPKGDYKAYVKKVIKGHWQQEWVNTQNNKLRKIKNSISPFATSKCKDREWEIKLARLRLGHTRYTHDYLMCGRHIPYCEDCIVPLTVEHFMVECPTYVESRRYLRGYQTLLSMLDDAGPVKAGGAVSAYLKDIGIYQKL